MKPELCDQTDDALGITPDRAETTSGSVGVGGTTRRCFADPLG